MRGPPASTVQGGDAMNMKGTVFQPAEVDEFPAGRPAPAHDFAADDAIARLDDFDSMRRQRALERRYLSFLKTRIDFDIACEIGFHHLAGSPLTIKQLQLLQLGPPVTIFRRLDRLCNLGIIVRSRSARDGRVHELRLTPAGEQVFAKYARLARE